MDATAFVAESLPKKQKVYLQHGWHEMDGRIDIIPHPPVLSLSDRPSLRLAICLFLVLDVSCRQWWRAGGQVGKQVGK